MMISMSSEILSAEIGVLRGVECWLTVNLRTSLGSQSNHLPKASPCYSLISVGESLPELLHHQITPEAKLLALALFQC